MPQGRDIAIGAVAGQILASLFPIGKAYRDQRAASNITVDLDIAAMQIHETLDNRKAKARATVF